MTERALVLFTNARQDITTFKILLRWCNHKHFEAASRYSSF